MGRMKDRLIEDQERAEILRKGTTDVEIIFERNYSMMTLPDIYNDLGVTLRDHRHSDACFNVVITKVE